MENEQNNQFAENSNPGWQYNSGQLASNSENSFTKNAQTINKYIVDNDVDNILFSWKASEFVNTEKDRKWYAILVIGAILLSVLIYIITKEIMSVLVILVMAVVLGVYGNVKPRSLEYSICKDGINIGEKHFNYSQFKSFSLFEDTALPSIQLMPLKRIAMPINIYISAIDADKIVETLGSYIPLETKNRDFADRLSHKLKF